MVSEVERGTKTPTVLVLDRLATALGSSIARLLDEPAGDDVVLLRHADQRVVRDPAGWERRILSPVLAGVEFEFMRTVLDAGVDAGEFAPHQAGSREYLAVESGVLRLTIDGAAAPAAPRRLRVLPRRPAARLRRARTPARARTTSQWSWARRTGATMADLRAALHRAADLAADHLDTVTDRPVWQPVPAADRAWLTGAELPEHGRPIEALLDDVARRVLPYPMGNGHPRFVGWVNSPPAPAGVAMAALAAALNPSCAGGEHAGALLEHTVTRWLAQLVGYPHLPGAGLLTSGASVATIVALAAARHRAARHDGWDVRADGLAGHPPMTVYVSAEGHACLRRAAELLGFGHRMVRTVAVDAQYRLDVADLRRQLAADRAAGLRPLCVAASAGTVGTGAVDPLDAVADVAAEYGLWFHVDGAYGALGVAGSATPADYRGMDRADSLVLDPHKWLGVPVDAGCVLFADPRAARDAFSLVPAYLRDESAGDLGWFAEYGPEQTRPLRALRVWATLANLGRAGVVELVDRTVALAQSFAATLAAADDFELLAPVSTSIVAFRHRPAGIAPAQLDAVNRAIPGEVQRSGRAFLTGTRLSKVDTRAEVEALRACFLNPDTTAVDLAVLAAQVRAAGERLR